MHGARPPIFSTTHAVNTVCLSERLMWSATPIDIGRRCGYVS